LCVSCGCALAGGSPTDDHDNDANLTLGDVQAAADAQGLTPEQVAQNIVASLAALTSPVENEPEAVEKRLAAPDNPKRFVLGVAYYPDRADGHKEWMSKENLERVAWDYVRKHRRVGWFHAGVEGHAEIVESYIWPDGAPDWVTKDIDGNEQVIKSGYWVLGGLLDEPGFEMVLRQKADGWSMDGGAKRRIRLAPIGDDA
jgi:hypothetical protein